MRSHGTQGKNTGVGCHFLLQCMKVKSESEVAQLCLTLCHPMVCSPPLSTYCLTWVSLTLDEGYLLTAAPPDLDLATLGSPAPAQPPLLGRACPLSQ